MFNIRIGGGVEGLGGELDRKLTTGPMWGAAFGIQPLPFLGAELGYLGSVHEVDSTSYRVGSDGAVAGADFVRNGGHVLATVNAPMRRVQPYALAGVGMDWYTFRGGPTIGADDDSSGRIPFGGGIRAEQGRLIGDLRFNYNILFSQNFARFSQADGIGSTWDLGLTAGGQF